MPVAAILGLAIPFAKEIIIAWMQAEGKTSVTLEELKTMSPDALLAQMGIHVE